MRPCLIGIAGPSCAGKSEVARALSRHLPAAVLGLDSYYVDLGHWSFEQRCGFNFDAPEALDRELLLRDLGSLSRGETIWHPHYSFETHSRSGAPIRFDPQPFVIVEGLFALYWPAVRDLMSLRVFVTAPDEICFARRQARDVIERGRSPESIRKQYDETVRPMAQRYVLPTAAFADLVLSGEQPIAQSCLMVEDHLRHSAAATA